MKHLKLYEGFFSKKKPFNDITETIHIVKETLLELSDNGYNIVVRKDEYGIFGDVTPFIVITITKDDSSDKVFKVIDIKDPLQFTISYLKDEVGLNLNTIVFRANINPTTQTLRVYTKLNQIKESDTTWSVEITFK